MQGLVPGESSFSSSRATEGYYAVRRENDADRESLMFGTSSLKSVLKEVGVQGSGELGSGGAARLPWAPSLHLFSCTWTPALGPGLTGNSRSYQASCSTVVPGITYKSAQKAGFSLAESPGFIVLYS